LEVVWEGVGYKEGKKREKSIKEDIIKCFQHKQNILTSYKRIIAEVAFCFKK
jgi:hypothetical protein